MGGCWLVVGGCGWFLACCGWLWVVFGWLWVVVGGCGWLLAGCGWLRVLVYPLLEYILASGLGNFIKFNNLTHKVSVDLTSERQLKTQGFLNKTSESHGTNLSRGQ